VMLSGRFLTKLMNNHRNQINLEEEINRNMKGKFKLFGHIGLALFLVSALVLTLAPVAQAATAVTNVWVEFPYTSSSNESDDDNSSNVYIVHFTPTTAISRGVDTVTVTFPDGSATMCGTASTNLAFTVGTLEYDDVEFSTDYGTAAVTDATWYKCVSDPVCGGYRVKATAPIDIAAGTDVWVKFDTTDGEIESGSTAGTSFKVYVATTQDTTGVLSSAFTLDDGVIDAFAVTSVSPSTAGSAGQYVFTFDPGTTDMTESEDTLTVVFPVGTVLPSSISASNVEFSTDGSAYTTCGVAPTVDQDRRMITATTPIAIPDGTDNTLKIKSAAGITNPTIASDDDYICMARSSDQGKWLVASAHTITAGSATQLIAANGEVGLASTRYSDDATMINMFSSAIYLTTADVNGNAKDPGSITVTPTSSSSTGTFYISGTIHGAGVMSEATTITVAAADPFIAAQEVFYKDSTAGTHTLTFSHASYTDATWTITVCPAVSLYDSNDELVTTYGPTTTATAAETAATGTSGLSDGSHYGSDYINDAITAALAGDTVKLGDGIYEVDNDSYITLNEKVTLTSVNGASSTTIRPTQDVDKAISVETSGTATNPVIIDGLTFQWLRCGTDIECAVRDQGKDYLTVRNCIFNNIEPDQGANTEGVIWIQNSAALTSITVSDNTFNNCVTTWPNMGSNYNYSGCIILDFAPGDYDVTGVTIDGNTLTDCGQYGITIGGYDDTSETGGYVTNNTITNGQCAINVFNNSDGVNITGNTITDAYSYGVYVEGNNNANLVIKNNTITGCAGEYYIADNTTIRGSAIVVEQGTSATDPAIQYNTITGSGYYALKVDAMISGASDTTVDCKYNWFGDASGPYYSALTGAAVTKSNPNGTGDAITDLAVYYPWLHKSLADVVADNVSYQTSNMYLVSGWNTMSTPVKLISTADSIDELIPSGMTIGYYYDGGWQQITTGYVLDACDAVYVKMSAATYVQFKFDAGAFTTPSKDLAAGWNLISLASLDSSKNVDNTMACVDLTAANLPGWSQVVSPSMNAAQTDIYGATETAWAESAGENQDNTMQPGLGYWCYMQNAATLAGFEVTPIVPDLD
jgi:hypothetical protein